MLFVFGNIITQKYTKQSVQSLSGELEELKKSIRTEMDNDNGDNEKLLEELGIIEENWTLRHDKLAYYIEHNELEKVEDNLTGLTSLVNTKEYSDAIKELDKCAFILRHIEEKYAFNLQNIF